MSDNKPVLVENNIFDHAAHAALARMTANISPSSLALAGVDWLLNLASSPTKLARLQKSMVYKAAKIGAYASQSNLGLAPEPVISPLPADQRFQSPQWQDWPYNVIHQNFLLCEEWWKEATTGIRGVLPHHQDVTSFTARQLLDIFAPSNNPFTNPDVIATTMKEGGMNFYRGYLHWLDDLSRQLNDKPPFGAEEFKLGENIAATKGEVIFRNNLIELIQYKATTKQVYKEPVLIIPAWIMKYYILDLSANNSLVKYLVDKGHTVFMISWKNPDAADRDLAMDDYINQGLMEALNTIKTITHEHIHTVGYCIGGTLLTILASLLAHKKDDTIKTMTLFAAQTDFEEAGELQLFIDESQVAFLEDVMWQQGYLDKWQMAGTFELLRSNDLVWSRLINDYMMGKRQTINDLMAWNADATRMPYRMHSQYLRELFLDNDLAEGRFKVNGQVIALKDIKVPCFCVGTLRDHIAPWKSVYKIHLLISSAITFVLTSGGHNAGIVSEPGHKGRSYQIATSQNYIPPEQWQNKTAIRQGSWWLPWQEFLAANSTGRIKARNIDNKKYSPLCAAPGTYVFAK